MTAPRQPGGGAGLPTEDRRAEALARLQGGRGRLAAADAEQRRYEDFLSAYVLPDTPDSVTLWLTWLLDNERPSGTRLRYRLRLLDIAAVVAGRPPPGDDVHVRSYVRGLHREAALGGGQDRTPLYSEDVRAVLDSIDADRVQQSGEIAMLLLADAVGLPSDVLCRLDWQQVSIRRGHMTIRVPERSRGRGPSGVIRVDALPSGPCPVAAMRELRNQVGPVPGPVFARREGVPPAPGTFPELLVGRDKPWRQDARHQSSEVLAARVSHLGRPTLTQARDGALFALAYSACLTNLEAMRLTVGDVRAVDQGLMIGIRGRAEATAIPPGARPQHCPVLLWDAWVTRLVESGHEDGPAFPAVTSRVVHERPVSGLRLNHIVATRCQGAGLRGDHTFTSLRLGFVRSAARDGVPEHAIMRQSGLRWLHSVESHVRRERLVSHSLAGRIGL